MKINLTTGMGGKTICELGDVETIPEVWSTIEKFKTDNVGKYKIEAYNRCIFDDGKVCTYVDFGDYSTFITVEGLTIDMMSKSHD